MYCGQKVLADDNKKGKHVHCPKCNHLVLINDAALIKVEREEPSDEEINSLLHKAKLKSLDTRPQGDEIVRGFLRKWFAPHFDELSIFLMVAAALLVAWTNNGIGDNVEKFIYAIFRIEPTGKMIWIYGVICIAMFFAAALPVYHVFSQREKYKWEKLVMLAIAVAFTAGSGIIAGRVMMKEAWLETGSLNGVASYFPYVRKICALNWRAIFPLWNIINGISIYWMFRAGVINAECYDNRDAKLWQVLLGLIILVGVFAICQYVLKTHWAVTYSICIVYSTNFVRWGDDSK